MRALVLGVCLLVLAADINAKYLATGRPYNVSYDQRALMLNGERALFMSGSVHYPRSTPEMWPSILSQTKRAGVNLIQTYVFWNLHEPLPGIYNWEGYANLTQFLDYCQEQELYVNLRIGPYVCAEWTYGGFPVWLRFESGIVFRDYSPPFMTAMQSWMKYVVNYLKPYFASNGGPIILAQVENEYGWLEKDYGQQGAEYASWAAGMANGLGIGIPWIMCSQDNIATVIDTCNGFYCDNWISDHQQQFSNQPSLFTENWTGWFQDWAVAKPIRPAQYCLHLYLCGHALRARQSSSLVHAVAMDLAFSVARFIARGGTHNNYYMWHGGSNFARWSGGPYIVTSYDYDAPLDEYGLPNEPKYNLLSTLHSYLNNFAPIIVANDPVYVSYSSTSESHTYGNTVAFLSNIDTAQPVNITYCNAIYTIPPWSVSIVNGGEVVFNTAVLPYTETRSRRMTPLDALGPSSNVTWTWAADVAGVWGTGISSSSPQEQINTTRDTTDYLWYTHNVTTTSSSSVTLSLNNTGDLVTLFINGTLIGKRQQGQITPIEWTVNVPAGTHTLQILSATVGLLNYGEHQEAYTRGLNGVVKWDSTDITSSGWTHQVGLKGEANKWWAVWSVNGAAVVNRPLTWYRGNFDLSNHDLDGASLALDIMGLDKGFVWVNGYSVGRFWDIPATSGGCVGCQYNVSYSPDNNGCQVGCGLPTQTYYHVPTSWLYAGANVVVLFTEGGGSIAGIDLVQRE